MYRYGFNGKENDNEVKGVGDQQDYGMRIYDPRVGRFLSVDPLTESFAMLSPYQFASNNPLYDIDLDGLEGFPANAAQGAAGERFVQTKLQLNSEYEVYEQITIRPDGMTKVANSRLDFLLRNQKTGTFYKVEVKTGDAVNSPNQTGVDNAVEKGDLLEFRSTKPDQSLDDPAMITTGRRFKLAGSMRARVNTKTGTLEIDSKTANPKVPEANAEMNNLEKFLENPKQAGEVNTILEGKEPLDNSLWDTWQPTEATPEADLPMPSPADIPVNEMPETTMPEITPIETPPTIVP